MRRAAAPRDEVPPRVRPLHAHLHLLHVRADEEAKDPAHRSPDRSDVRVLLAYACELDTLTCICRGGVPDLSLRLRAGTVMAVPDVLAMDVARMSRWLAS